MSATAARREAVRRCLEKRRTRLKAAGICVSCGSAPVRAITIRKGTAPALCLGCASDHTSRRLQKRQEQRAQGICYGCGKRPAREGSYRCAVCAPPKMRVVKPVRPTAEQRLERMMAAIDVLMRKPVRSDALLLAAAHREGERA